MKKSLFLLFLLALLVSTAPAQLLKGKTFSSLEIKYEGVAQVTLGQNIKIGIVAMNEKGKEFKTPGFLSPGLLKTAEWNNFKVEAEGATFADGTITISSNALDIKNHEVKITASSVKNPEVKTELVIKLNYKGSVVFSADGAMGRRGSSGSNGAKGGNAVTSSDRSAKGGSGGPGGQGGNGGDGNNIDVFITVKADDLLKKDMVYVQVVNKTTGTKQLVIADPVEGKIAITANGGDGGSGGQGGQGGQGGDDSYRQSSSNGGDGGAGGSGGTGGNGGTITVYMDPSTDKVNTSIDFSNAGGLSGRPGEGGLAGPKGYYESSYGAKGPNGSSGQEGNKGPAVKVIKQKVEIN